MRKNLCVMGDLMGNSMVNHYNEWKIHGNFSQNQRNFTVTSTQLASFGRTWWPLCATWTAAMWAIDPCDWRRATGRRGASDRPNWVIQNYWYSEIYNGDILVNFGDIGIIGYFGEQKKGGMIQQNGNIMGYTYIYIYSQPFDVSSRQ